MVVFLLMMVVCLSMWWRLVCLGRFRWGWGVVYNPQFAAVLSLSVEDAHGLFDVVAGVVTDAGGRCVSFRIVSGGRVFVGGVDGGVLLVVVALPFSGVVVLWVGVARRLCRVLGHVPALGGVD